MTNFKEELRFLNEVQGTPFTRKLDVNGDGTGATNMVVDGSSSPVTYKITPASNEVYVLYRAIFYISDNSSFDSGGWGALGGTPLSNGCELKRKVNGMIYTAITMTSNGELASICHDLIHRSWGSGAEFLTARLTFTRFSENGVILDGSKGDELQFVINDDLTGLVKQYVTLEGEKYII